MMVSDERMFLQRAQFCPHGSLVFGGESFGAEFLTTWFLIDFARLKATMGRLVKTLDVKESFSRTEVEVFLQYGWNSRQIRVPVAHQYCLSILLRPGFVLQQNFAFKLSDITDCYLKHLLFVASLDKKRGQHFTIREKIFFFGTNPPDSDKLTFWYVLCDVSRMV